MPAGGDGFGPILGSGEQLDVAEIVESSMPHQVERSLSHIIQIQPEVLAILVLKHRFQKHKLLQALGQPESKEFRVSAHIFQITC